VTYDEIAVVVVHRQGAGHDHPARQISRLIEHLVNARPMHGEQHRIRLCGLARFAVARLVPGVARQRLELLLASRVAEGHLVSGSREDRAKLAAHQPRTQNADPHATSPALLSDAWLR